MIRIKNTRQINGIRKSCKLAAESLNFIAPQVLPGVSTKHLNDELENFIRKHGAIPAPLGYLGFPAATCISVNEVICHGIPSDYKLKDGDIVNIDVTTILDGYYGDTSRMFVIGNVSAEAKRLVEVAEKSLIVGIEEVKPNNFFGNIGYKIAEYAEKEGFSVVHQFCGHGTGLAFHEDPQIPHTAVKDSGERMRKGYVFTIEPMINSKAPEAMILEDKWTAVTIDGGLSAQWEHTVLVTSTGCEILTL